MPAAIISSILRIITATSLALFIACFFVLKGSITPSLYISDTCGLLDSRLIKGVIIDKEKVHPDMPEEIKNAKVALLNLALEIMHVNEPWTTMVIRNKFPELEGHTPLEYENGFFSSISGYGYNEVLIESPKQR